MAQILISILDEQAGQQIGQQLFGVLNREDAYEVRLVKTPDAVKEGVHDLLIAVLPESITAADRTLAEVDGWRQQFEVLTVVRPEALDTFLDCLAGCDDDFMVASVEEPEIRIRVARVAGKCRKEVYAATKNSLEKTCALAQIVGEDPGILELKRKIPRVAGFQSNVLLVGETGTGKERSAHALHYTSRRARKPFVPVNCGAIPPDLFESEMYGHERGAFTGAHASRLGLVAEAEGGTLFLDEIETLNPGVQVKLLRFLQDQTYYAVGSPKSRRADVWVIAASNTDLLGRARAGMFREDLFYRIAGITLHVPPLRDRKMDIPLLAMHFLKKHEARYRTGELKLSACALRSLCNYDWPGNVRELENVILQGCVFSKSPEIRAEDLPLPCPQSGETPAAQSFQRSKAEAIEQFERKYVEELLESHDGNVSRAARTAKKERRAFGRLVKKYDLKSFKAS